MSYRSSARVVTSFYCPAHVNSLFFVTCSIQTDSGFWLGKYLNSSALFNRTLLFFVFFQKTVHMSRAVVSKYNPTKKIQTTVSICRILKKRIDQTKFTRYFLPPVMDTTTTKQQDNSAPVCDEITFEDCAQSNNPLSYIPPHLHQKARHLPEGTEYTLLKLDPPGAGHNKSLLRVASACYQMGVSADDTLEHLSAAYSKERIDHATAPKRAIQRVWQVSGQIDQLTSGDGQGAPGLQDEMLLRFRRLPSHKLIDATPAECDVPTIEVINALFAPGDIINIQKTALEFGTLTTVNNLESFIASSRTTIDDWKFLNPSVFKKVEGVPNTLHPDKKISTRCNDNVKRRNWMVLEMDSDSIEQRERFNMFALSMSKYAPLVMAMDSGGKSIHFWFNATECPPNVKTAFFNLACMHGADKALAVKSQIARMPNVSAAKVGRRKQSVLYFDPEGINTPDIWDLTGWEDHIKQHKSLDFYYSQSGGYPYLTRDTSESWIQMNRTSVKVAMAERGIRIERMEGEQISPADSALHEIEMTRAVDAVLNSASGRHSGYYEENGARAIVKTSPAIIKPRQGDFPTIDKFITGLLGRDKMQIAVFYGWLSQSIKDLRNGGRRRAIFSPSQMLHIAGEPNAGKTLLLKDILTPCFGGRNACADSLFKKFAGDFNSDMFGSELLFLDDSPVLETGYQFRVDFGERIKSHVVGIGGSYHQKGVDRINMRPWWRFIRLMNTEPATLATLPPMDDGIEDKIIILKAWSMKAGPLGSEMTVPKWYDKIEARIAEEIPAFINYLLDDFTLPAEARDPDRRFAVMSYKNRDLMTEILGQSPEQYLLHRIDTDAAEILFGCGLDFDHPKDVTTHKNWKGSVDTLFDLLCNSGTRTTQVRFTKICPSPRVLLSQLRSMEKNNPERVGYSERVESVPNKYNGSKYWVISPRGKMLSGEVDVVANDPTNCNLL